MCIMTAPVLNTRQVLLDHLLAKVIPLCSTKLVAKEILLEIANNLQNKDILELLQDDKLLLQVVDKSNAYKNEKQELGEELFYKVSDIESDLCAKITGMLLELDTNTIKQLLSDEEQLCKAVIKAKREYVEYTNQAKKREELGEKLYDLVCEKFRPEIASRLTGMLLELEPEVIHGLLKSPKDLEAMATQQELSDFIKKVHIDLRLTSREVGVKAAWEKHCKNDDVLKKYAETMRNLATVYWDKNIEQNINRIYWVVKECDNYFSQRKQREIFEKEQKMSLRYFGDTVKCEDYILPQTETLELLDVGSCYNPFKQFEQFNVTAIDLAPATPDVLRCDFLNVILEDYFVIQENSMISLPRQYFDVVVFSLLLEYLPHPSLRYDCCLKAYELLRPGGALLIITPDSKHPSANSQLIKNWRMALAHLGFIKVSYEKTEHLHCMTYSKYIDARLPRKWLSLQRIESDPETLMIIPQDNVQYKTGQRNEERSERCESDNKIIVDNFSVLAGDCLF